MNKIEGAPGAECELEQTLERTALDGAAAIQRIIDERDRLRSLTQSQQAETTRWRGASEDFRRRLLEVRKHYLELATEILGQLEKFDGALREATKDLHAASSPIVRETAADIVQRVAFARNLRTDSQGGP